MATKSDIWTYYARMFNGDPLPSWLRHENYKSDRYYYVGTLSDAHSGTYNIVSDHRDEIDGEEWDGIAGGWTLRVSFAPENINPIPS